ncbi:MAG: type II toxin-antitoxin system VapC family toxin [Candidatus Binatus sp.]|uniref:PIN domain-containing protein n=1 Tax=Candidatus Binatus sp. TaxID=2811406 RepID=UPI003D09B060
MRGVDTNILVRYLVADDPAQLRAATRFIEHECSPQEPGFINRLVLAEVVWVLESSYKLPRSAVVNALRLLFDTDQLSIEHAEDARVALRDYEDGADFWDSLIAATNARLGCEYTATLDRRAARRKGFRLVQ